MLHYRVLTTMEGMMCIPILPFVMRQLLFYQKMFVGTNVFKETAIVAYTLKLVAITPMLSSNKDCCVIYGSNVFKFIMYNMQQL